MILLLSGAKTMLVKNYWLSTASQASNTVPLALGVLARLMKPQSATMSSLMIRLSKFLRNTALLGLSLSLALL
jgi:hypothetical protein